MKATVNQIKHAINLQEYVYEKTCISWDRAMRAENKERIKEIELTQQAIRKVIKILESYTN